MTGIDDAANDHFFSAQGDLKAGWSTSYARTLSPGDLDRDGHADILTINAAGTMQFHGGTGNTATTGGLKAPVTGGSGWGALDQVSGAGNFDGDVNGRIDLLAREKATGKLFLYPGLGTGKFATRVEVGGTTWNTYNLLVGTLDFNGDKYPDLIARKPDGTLWMFRGNGSGAGQFISTTPTSLGSGWQQFSSLLAPGDFDGDGRADLLARRATDGKGLIYPGTGGVSGYFLPLRPLRVVAVPSTWLAIAGS